MLSSQFPLPLPHSTMSKTITNAALLLSVAITQLTIMPSKSNTNIKRAVEAFSSSSSSEEIGVAVFNTHEPTRYSWNPHPKSVHFIPLTSPEGKHELLQLERRPQVRKLYSDTLVAGIFDATYESGNHGTSKSTSKILEQVTSTLSPSTKASTSAKPKLRAPVLEIHLKEPEERPTTHNILKTTLAPSTSSFFENYPVSQVNRPAISELALPLPSNEDSKESKTTLEESSSTQVHFALNTAQQAINSKNDSFLKLKQISISTESEKTASKGQLQVLVTNHEGPSGKPDEDSRQLLSSEESYEEETINLAVPEPLPVSSSTSTETATERPVAPQSDFENLKEISKNVHATGSVGSVRTSTELPINQKILNLNESIKPPSNPADYYNSQQSEKPEESSKSSPKSKQQHNRVQQGRSIVTFKSRPTNASSRVQNIQKHIGLKSDSNEFGISHKHVGQTEHLTVEEQTENQGQGIPGNPVQSGQRNAKISGRRVVPSGRRVIPHVTSLRTTTQTHEDLDVLTSNVTVPTENPVTFKKIASFSTPESIANSGYVLPAPPLVPEDHESLTNPFFNGTPHPKANDSNSIALVKTNQLQSLMFPAQEYVGSTTELHAAPEALKLTTTKPTIFTSASLPATANLEAFPTVRSNFPLVPTPTKASGRHSSSFGRSVKGLLETLRSALNVPASSSLHSAETTEPTTFNRTVSAAQNKSVAVHMKATDGTHVILRANFTSFSAKNSSTNKAKKKIMPNVSPESLANLSFAIQDLVQAIKKHNFHHGKHAASHNEVPFVPKPPETVQNPTNISTSQKDIKSGSPEAVLIHIRAPDGTTFDLQANSSSSLWSEFQEMVKVVKFWHENQHDMNHKWNETDAHPLLPQPELVQLSLAGLVPLNVGINQVGRTFVVNINSENQSTSPKTIVKSNELNATKVETLIARPTKRQRKAKQHRRKLKSYKRLRNNIRKDPLLLPAIEFALQDAIRRYERSKGYSSKVSKNSHYDEQLEMPNLMEMNSGTRKSAVTFAAKSPIGNVFGQNHPNTQTNIEKQMRLKNERSQFGTSQKHSGQTQHWTVEGHEEMEGQGTSGNPDQSGQRSAKINGRRVAPSGRRVTPAGRSVLRASKQNVLDQIKSIIDSAALAVLTDKPKYASNFASLKNNFQTRTKQTEHGFKHGEKNSPSDLFHSTHTTEDETVGSSSEEIREAGRVRKLRPGVLKTGKSREGMRGRTILSSTSKSNRKRIDLENEIQESKHAADSPGFESDRSIQGIRASESLNEMASPLAKTDDESLVYKETFSHHKPDILPTTLTKYPLLMKGLHVYPAAGPTTRIPFMKPLKKITPQPKKTPARGRAATSSQSQGHSAVPDPEKFTLHDILIRAYKNGRIKP